MSIFYLILHGLPYEEPYLNIVKVFMVQLRVSVSIL